MSERILITGADGFVGRALARALLPRLGPQDRLYGGQRRPDGTLQQGVEANAIDVTDAVGTREAIRRLQPTCVVHLAAIAAIQEASQDKDLTWAVNFGGTRILAEAILEDAPAARVVFVSTSEVYGGTFKTCRGGVDESAPLDPANPYAASKAAADLLIGQMVREGLRAVRFRPFNHTGPGQTERFVVPAFAAQIARIEAGLQDPVIHVGNLDAVRDFLDIRDVVEAYIRAILRPGLPDGVVLNLASGAPRRIGDILADLTARAARPIEIALDPARLRPSDTPVAFGNADRAANLLAWCPQIPWTRTLDDVLDDWRHRVLHERVS
ncbi:GDP-mannose 4,6-dehydratase [Methylobacterium durans]|uniref:GDP-mannose 4,6-dehydratase n=1 Tax=Methylobacterium durans TaxID=2202825 RepID=UPI002B001294|nr:GDP-mannose 4,6-dehydratase [Methylobacterium durans]MEA1832402.1 GDP-mannose 4,6-dehydratase [Methylobacterium durans]